VDGHATDAEMLGGFGDGVLFSLYAIALYHNSSRVDWFCGSRAVAHKLKYLNANENFSALKLSI
jgi:hypothetical protein